MDYPNFYESIPEAQIRLRNTVVLYEGEPYFIFAITDHVGDGVFRVFMMPLVNDKGKPNHIPDQVEYLNPGSNELGAYLDKLMESSPGRFVRKFANSEGFNKFRPFPLGMCAHGNAVYYLERQPNRVTQQGLLKSMIFETRVDCGSIAVSGKRNTTVNILSQEFVDCVKGDYNTPQQCLEVLRDVDNYDYSATAFHRDFALVRGPCDMTFLGYKDDIIGFLPYSDFSRLQLGREFVFCREVVEELKLFDTIV